IRRIFDVSPQFNVDLNVGVIYHYLKAEYEGDPLLEYTFDLYRSGDHGVSWERKYGDLDTAARTISLAGLNHFSWLTGGSSPISPLPVTLLTFNTVCENGIMYIQWSTLSEINSESFTVQRSEDMVFWEDITVMSAAGNSNQIRHYASTDKRPLP